MKEIRRFIRSVITETYGSKMVKYSAVMIEDPLEIQKIEELYRKYVPETGWTKTRNFHMTISLGPIPESLELRGDLNKEVELTIGTIGKSDRAIALGTFGYYSKNDIPHITLAFNKRGGEPADSKFITDWQTIQNIKIKGVIREVGYNDKALQEIDAMNMVATPDRITRAGAPIEFPQPEDFDQFGNLKK